MLMSALSLLSINTGSSMAGMVNVSCSCCSLYVTASFRDPLEGNMGLNIRLRVFCVCV